MVSVGLVGNPIRCIAVSKDLVFVAERDCVVSSWRRGKNVAEYVLNDAPIVAILVMGSLLLTLDEQNVVVVYTIATAEVFIELDDMDDDHFAVTTMVHPSTYLNKVWCSRVRLAINVVAHFQVAPLLPPGIIREPPRPPPALESSFEAHGVSSHHCATRLLAAFTHNRISFRYEFEGYGSAVSCLESAPVLDVVAVGHEDGCVVLLDIKQDSALMKLCVINVESG